MARIKYRLALDMGANSLGWCVYRLDDKDEPDRIVRMGHASFQMDATRKPWRHAPRIAVRHVRLAVAATAS